MMNSRFRYDINGLRAYAVTFVVLFHFGVFGFSGGFIGVDVFFVISGFLMTKIIFSALQEQTFSFLKFYISRANRIIPPLVALILVLTVLGYDLLYPQYYKDFSKHAISSLGFLSNIQYFRESGYFDTDSHFKILLHTWSLSVEWQFYILLPIILWILKYSSTQVLKLGFLLIFIVSLILSIFLTPKYPTASFYLDIR